MPGAAIGAVLGFFLSGTGLGIGLAGFLGISAGALWMVGASLGSLFDGPDIDLGGSTPNYSFGPLSNTKSQLLPIPLVYGRCRVGGNIFLQKFDTEERKNMDMMIGLSTGPINKVVSVYADDHILYDEALPDYTYWVWKDGNWDIVEYLEYLGDYMSRKEIRDINGDVVTEKLLEDCSCDIYTGTATQNADSREPDGNTYPNLAYVALTLKAQEGLSGNPVITSIIEGRKVWTPSGVMYTRNPAWIIYDVLTDAENGIGIPTAYIDLDSFEAAAVYCDALVEGEPRFTLDYIIDTQRPAVDHLQSMLACFRGYFLARDKIELHVEQAGSVYKALGPDNFVKDSFSWWQKSGDDSPNRITLEWIDPNNHYEQSSAVFEYQEDIQARGVFEKSFSVLGITRSSQVGRLGNYLMETAKRVQNFCSFQVGLQDADIEAGEIISLTYPDFTGWDEKPFRVVAVQDHGDSGVVTVTCAEYDATVYGDDALPVQTPIVDPTPVTYDDVYSLALEDTGHIADDGTWVPIIKASWQNPSDYTPKEINVRYRYQGTEEWTLVLNTTSILTSANLTNLTTGENVEVWVNCKRPNGTYTSGDVAVITVGRDITPPVAPTSLTATGWFGSIDLEWVNPADRDLSHIEVWENAIDNRATAVKIAETKGTSYQRYVGSFITRYYWVRAVDFSGNIGAWNATAGTAGNSDQENHQDFVDLLLEENPYLNEAIGDLNTPVDSLAESGIWNALSDYKDVIQDTLWQRMQDKLAEAAIQAELGTLNDVKYTIATINEERVTREEEDMVLASQILTISAMLGDPYNPGEGTVYAALVSERTARVTADEAMAANIDALTAVIGDPWNPGPDTIYAAIKTEQTARANADGALASQVNTLTTSIGNPSSPAPGTVHAAIKDEAEVRASADSALASNVTTLQTKVDGNTNSVQVLSQSVDGVKGKYAVKIDTNGYVTGYELIGTGASSSMVFHVDNFLVGKPGATNKYPFVIGTVDGVSRVSMDSAFIQDAAIDAAKIKDGAIENAKIGTAVIDTAHIKNGAVTNRYAAYTAGSISLTSSYKQTQSVSISTTGKPLSVTYNASLTGATSALITITIDGIVYRSFPLSSGVYATQPTTGWINGNAIGAVNVSGNFSASVPAGGGYIYETIISYGNANIPLIGTISHPITMHFYETMSAISLVMQPVPGNHVISVVAKINGGYSNSPSTAYRFLEVTELKR